MITKKNAARMIDISAVRSQHGIQEIEQLVLLSKKFRFVNVHVLPSWVSTLSKLLQDEDDILVGSPVGFPDGGHTTATKIAEAVQMLNDGVQEMDIVMNIGMFKSGKYDYVLRELKAIVDIVDGRIPTKVIIEINTLTDEELFKACDLVMASGADFIKTGTGWVPGDANIERIRKIKQHCGNRIKVKAAGGIRTKEQFLELVDMGVERMGINTKSAMEIIDSLPD